MDSPTPFTGTLPLDLTEQARTAVEEVLRASYRSSPPTFSNLIDDFVQEPDNLFRGPYLSLDLPYTSTDTDTKPFPSVHDHRHGHGFGQDRMLPATQPSIKAIVIYPMNALAEDQARCLATRIWDSPELRGRVTTGMYGDAELPDWSPSWPCDDFVTALGATP